MFAVLLSYKYYLKYLFYSSVVSIFRTLWVDKHSVTDGPTEATKKGLRIRDGPERLNRVNSFVTGGRTLSSSPLLYKRRRKLLSSCLSNFAGAATSNLFGDFS